MDALVDGDSIQDFIWRKKKKPRTIEIWKVMAADIQWGDYNREGSELNSSRGPLSESSRAVRGRARGSQVRQPECRS